MIVVIGSPVARVDPDRYASAGLGVAIALAAVADGASVQLVGRVGEDPAGDAILLGLAAAGVGHVAVLREPGRPTPILPAPIGAPAVELPTDELLIFAGAAAAATADEAASDVDEAKVADRAGVFDGLSVDAADLELALRYVPDYRVVVVAAELDPTAMDAAIAAAGWSGAHLIALLGQGSSPAAIPDTATVLERPRDDPDGAFAAMIASYATGLDEGVEPSTAFAVAQRAGGWVAVSD